MKTKKEEVDLYLRQGKTFLKLLEQTNAKQNLSKIKTVKNKISQAEKKLRQEA
ncbi:hypothetical protein RDV78_08220 [Bacillota bacterium LX-D]|nr:hypothetical protein [Bacillota bacterium LX-D]